MNYHYGITHNIIPDLVLHDTHGPLTGPRVADWLQFQADHPDHPVVQALRNV
jgi:hypothetical protein